MKKKGFTLIELLVTIVLFSLLLATALYSFRFISINIRTINNTNPTRAINYNLLRGVFSSLYYYIDSNSEELNIDKRLYFYFHGDSNRCRFITKSSIFHDELVIAELFYKDKELWYKESQIFDKKLNYKQLDRINMNKKKLLLKNIDNLKFKYILGNNNFELLDKKIPKLIIITFKLKLKQYSYMFYIKSKNIERLRHLKFERKES
jgi:prepilin-type N-terminal cleavage/methylation domain-containing protein